jgi:phospholipase A2
LQKVHINPCIIFLSQEWVEFSPFEIGVAKYGTYSKPENFGSKFFLGNVIKKFEEPPLHFLQGIWGSAYSIQFKRLVKEYCGIRNSTDEDKEEADGKLQLPVCHMGHITYV